MTMAGCYSPSPSTVVLVPVVLGGPGLGRETGLTEVSLRRLIWTLSWHRGARTRGPMRRVHGGRSSAPLQSPDAALLVLRTWHRLYSPEYPSDASSSAPACCRSGGPRQQRNNKQPSCGGRCGNSPRGAHMALNALASSVRLRPPSPLTVFPPTATGHARRPPPPLLSPRLFSLGPY